MVLNLSVHTKNMTKVQVKILHIFSPRQKVKWIYLLNCFWNLQNFSDTWTPWISVQNFMAYPCQDITKKPKMSTTWWYKRKGQKIIKFWGLWKCMLWRSTDQPRLPITGTLFAHFWVSNLMLFNSFLSIQQRKCNTPFQGKATLGLGDMFLINLNNNMDIFLILNAKSHIKLLK